MGKYPTRKSAFAEDGERITHYYNLMAGVDSETIPEPDEELPLGPEMNSFQNDGSEWLTMRLNQ